jgi:flavodoxin I
MAKIGIFYGSSTGNTEAVANQIKDAFGDADIFEINADALTNIASYDVVLLGSSTWGFGDLQDEWEDVLDSLDGLDLTGKKVSFFGTGDQFNYDETFCDAMGILYEALQNSGANFIGKVLTDSYQFSASRAVVDDQFVGLALDEDNQNEMTDDRIQAWVQQLKSEIA